MSDVGKLKRSGGSPFPSVRKSADPFIPEMGEIDFSQDVEEFDSQFTTAVQEAEKTEQNIISEENRNKQFQKQKKQKKKEQEEELEEEVEEEGMFVDLTV